MLDFFIFTEPNVAKTLLNTVLILLTELYKRKYYGYDGAFYAWESRGDFDACSDYNVTDVFTGRPMGHTSRISKSYFLGNSIWNCEIHRYYRRLSTMGERGTRVEDDYRMR